MEQNLITLTDMVAGFEEMGDRYISAASFADDVREVLSLASRKLTNDCEGRLNDVLQMVRPGQWEFECNEHPYTLQIRKPGIAELQRGHGLPGLSDKCPVSVLSVMKAEKIKEGHMHETFLLLKGPPIKSGGGADMPRFCFLLHRQYGKWEAYQGGLLRWVKRTLWPEVVG